MLLARRYSARQTAANLGGWLKRDKSRMIRLRDVIVHQPSRYGVDGEYERSKFAHFEEHYRVTVEFDCTHDEVAKLQAMLHAQYEGYGPAPVARDRQIGQGPPALGEGFIQGEFIDDDDKLGKLDQKAKQ